MELLKWNNIRYEIEQAKDWDTLQVMTDKVKAFQAWARQTKQSLETQNQIAEYRLRLERTKGNWLDENIPQGGDRGNQYTGGKVEDVDLAKIGISKYESSISRQIASIPDETFEEFVEDKKRAINNAVSELTATGAVRLAKSIKEKKNELDVNISINKQLEVENELKEIAKEINIKYTKDQRRFFVNLIKI